MRFGKIFDVTKHDVEVRTLQKQAWDRAMNKAKPNAGTPHDWEDYEKIKEKKDG